LTFNEWGHVHVWGRTGRRLRGVPEYRCQTCEERIYSKRAGGPQEGAFPWGLSRQEWEMVRWVAEGRSRPWIAHHMGTKTTTVNVYLHRIRAKIGVRAQRKGVEDTGSISFAYHCYVNRNASRGWRT
jgi:DNA-binding CsgD family transcriptional regulator